MMNLPFPIRAAGLLTEKQDITVAVCADCEPHRLLIEQQLVHMLPADSITVGTVW